MKLIILIIVFYVAYRLISALLTGKAQPPAFDAKKPPVRDGEETVFDAVCKSYVPKSIAVIEKKDGSLFYFCGMECKEKFLKS